MTGWRNERISSMKTISINGKAADFSPLRKFTQDASYTKDVSVSPESAAI